MNIKLIFTGKTAFSYIKEGTSIYEKRLSHYVPFEIITVDASKKSVISKNVLLQKQYEAELILKTIKPNDYLVVMDERGKEYSSVQFAGLMQKWMTTLQHDLIFISGSAYGFDERIYKKASMLLSISKMTFSHQMIRLIFLEQLYRAMTIIRNEPYHHG